MNPIARSELIRELEHMKQYGTTMSMLFMTARGTRHMLVAGIEHGVFSLDYPHRGWRELITAYRFASFCRRRGFAMRKETWWKDRVIRAAIGSVAIDAAQTIGECFSSVFHVTGPFGLKLQPVSWKPAGSARSTQQSLAPDTEPDS